MTVRLALPNRQVACQAIIFDKDGTLVDLMGIDLTLGRARAAGLAQAAGEQAAAAWQQAVGFDAARGWMDRDGPLCLAPRHEEEIVAAAVLYRLGYPWDRARALARQAYDQADLMLEPPYGGQLLPGVAGLLADLAGRGLRLAIATTDRGWRAERALAALGVAGYFAAVVGAEDVTNGKPAPDMVVLACERLRCPPAAAIVVGDSPIDMEMGRAAGVAATIGVTTGLNDAARLAELADVVLPDVTRLPSLFLRS